MSAFAGCSSLTSMSIPNNVTFIGAGAFTDCASLKIVKLSDGIKVIPYGCFAGCSSLETLYLPSSLDSIKNSSFYNCSSLTSINIPNSVKYIGGIESKIGHDHGGMTFYNCKNLTSVSIPDSVELIPWCAFAGCSNLEKVELGRGVKELSRGSFGECRSLVYFTCNSEKPPYVPDYYYTSKATNAFLNTKTSIIKLYVPESAIDVYKSTSPWSKFGSIKKIGCKLTLIASKGGKIQFNDAEVNDESKIFELPNMSEVLLLYIPDFQHHVESVIIDNEKFEGDYPSSHIYNLDDDMVVNVLFAINKYKLIYKIDGKEYKTYDVGYGETISPEATPMMEGYSFSGWSDIPETMPANDVTIEGTFTVNKYKLTYIVDGEEYKSFEIDYGADIKAEPTPTKEGYTFSGWGEIPKSMPAKDVTITGSFSINSYKLTYMIDDEVYKEVTYEYGSTITPEQQPEGNYETFEWTDLPQTMPAHDVVVHANYTTGIAVVLMSSQHNVRIYSPNGKKRNKLQKGLNIVIFDDGTVHKIWMK